MEPLCRCMGVFYFKEMAIRFDSLHNLFDRVQKLNEEQAWYFAIDRGTQRLIIDLNTKNQLGQEGIDSLEDSLGQYAPFTVEFRLSKGLQVGHIDFKVTGEYWGSWKVRVTRRGLEITVDQNRFSELVNELRFSEHHVGLTERNWAIVTELIRANYQQYVKQTLLR